MEKNTGYALISTHKRFKKTPPVQELEKNLLTFKGNMGIYNACQRKKTKSVGLNIYFVDKMQQFS